MALLRALLAVVVLLVSASGALAHAGLIAADPPAGSVLPDAPAALTLTYTEPVSPISFSLIEVGGVSVPLPDFAITGPEVKVTLPHDLKRGSYLFSWRVTSEDGHPVNGTVDFAVGAASGPLSAAAADPAVGVAIWLVRTLQYVALFGGVGSFAFGLLAPLPGGARKVALGAAAMGLVLAPVAVGLQGLDLLGLPLSAFLTSAPWAPGAFSTYGATELALAAAFVLAPFTWRALPAAAALLGIVGLLLSGHASTAEPQALMRLAVAVHIASLMFWLGALLPLWSFLRAGALQPLRGFSRLAPYAIAGLVLSGLVLAVVQLGPIGSDWLSAYGVLLAIKLGLVGLLLLLALWNRVRLTAPALRGEVAPLRRAIVIELILAVLIFGAVAGWRFTPPPRVLAEIAEASAPTTVTLSSADRTATLTAQPGHVGPVTLTLDLGVTARAVTLRLSNAAATIATISRPARLVGGTTWAVDDLLLPAAGTWSVEAEARTGDFDLAVLRGTLPVSPSPAPEAAMSPSSKLAAAAATSLLLAAPVAAATDIVDTCPAGQTFAQAGISVTGAFMRATPKGAQSAGAYFVVSNGGSSADSFEGASSGAAPDITLHSMTMNGNVMEMAPVDEPLEIPAGGSVQLDPSGYHLMLTGMPQGFAQGQCVRMVLHFAKAGDLPIELNVGGFAQKAPPAGDASSSMDMSGMSGM
jgi:copper transport protein